MYVYGLLGWLPGERKEGDVVFAAGVSGRARSREKEAPSPVVPTAKGAV